MNIRETKGTLSSIISEKKHIPVMIWGAPGIGKSQAVAQVALEHKMDFIDLRLSLLNPVDLRGLPVVDREKNKAIWLTPEFLPSEGRGILFLDEINLAPFSVMAAGYQLILDRRVGTYKLPDDWFIVAAGNRVEDNSNVTKFPAPLANRFVHLFAEHDIEEWTLWAVRNGINEHILSFLGKFPQHLYKAPQAGQQQFPSPRSWVTASDLYSLRQPIEYAVGEGVGSEFNSFLKVYKKLPDVNAILSGEIKDLKIPDTLDVRWALVMAIATRAKEKHVPIVFKVAEMLGDEFSVLLIRMVTRKSDDMFKAIKTSREWKNWRLKNKDFLKEDV